MAGDETSLVFHKDPCFACGHAEDQHRATLQPWISVQIRPTGHEILQVSGPLEFQVGHVTSRDDRSGPDDPMQ